MNATRKAQPIDLATIDLKMVESRIHRRLGVECWEWMGGRATNGYGYVSRGRARSKIVAHRVVYTIYRGQIPDGLPLDHLCRNRGCVNPEHLEPVSMRENTLRGLSPSAVHARKTHCIRGHEFTQENTYLSSRESRTCRECARLHERKRPSGWARQRASAERKSA